MLLTLRFTLMYVCYSTVYDNIQISMAIYPGNVTMYIPAIHVLPLSDIKHQTSIPIDDVAQLQP